MILFYEMKEYFGEEEEEEEKMKKNIFQKTNWILREKKEY
jgi:hypothetical protein